jgi:hypothetical protein
MADNITVSVFGGGSAVMATDDIGSVHFERVKMTLGDDGTNSGDVSASNPMPALERRPGTSSTANVTGSASSVTLLAANSARLGAMLFNDSSAALYVKLGATASTSSFTVKLAAGGYFELPHPCYTGIIDGIWDSATGAARVTEVTA